MRSLTTLAWLLALAGAAGAGEPSGTVEVLNTNYRWAVHITMLTPAARGPGGELTTIASDIPGSGGKVATEPPPEAWIQPDFDDAAWPRAPGPYPLLTNYAFGSVRHAHHFALFCVRGKFLVDDPARAEGMKLSLSYRGGAVVYLNGKEIARGHMPEGKVAFDTPAQDYPQEVCVDAQGKTLPADWECKKELAEKAAQRTRRLENVAVPAAALRKGVNVLAVELHRAPQRPPEGQGRVSPWVGIGFFGLSLAAPQGSAVTPGGSPPKELRVFNALAAVSLHNLDRFDAWEPLRPIALNAPRNAGASGLVVVCGPGPIRGLAASAIDLESKGGGKAGRIPLSAIEVRYALPDLRADDQEAQRFPDRRGKLSELRRQLRRFDALEEEAPAEVPAAPGGEAALQPVWVTVNVPRDAAPGRYEGTLRIKADGMAQVEVPLSVEVAGVTVPEPARGASYAGIVQSPDTLAAKYKVKLWSDEHWRLIARSFSQLGRLGGDFLAVPLVRRTFYGNEESMVRWVRGKDGTLRHDLKIFERYLDCAIKEMGPPRLVCLCVWEPINAYSDPGPEGKGMKAEVTVVGESGEPAENAPVPYWGTPECRPFWKPVFADIRKALAARGLEAAMCAGNAAQACPGKAVFEDLEEISPGIKWFALRHEWWEKMGNRETAISVGVYGTPGRVGPGRKYAYSWQDPRLWAVWPRTSVCDVREWSAPIFYRLFMDQTMIAGTSGIGNIGGDFWEVVPAGGGGARSVVRDNWVQLTMSGWGTPGKLIAPGAKAPIGTARLEMLREGVQDAEVRVLVEKALADDARRAQLGAEWEKRARDTLAHYTRTIFLAHPPGGKGQGAMFHDSFTWYALALPGMKKELYEVAAGLEPAGR